MIDSYRQGSVFSLLLVEDNPADADLVVEFLEERTQGSDLVVQSSLAAAFQTISSEADPFGMILLDLGLPDSQGIDTLRAVVQVAPDIPIIVLTGRDDDDLALQAINEGAQDYLVKGRYSSDLLWRSISYARERKRRSIELRTSEEKYRVLVENQSDLVIQFDLDFRVLFVSPSYCRAFKIEESEMLGRPFFPLIHEDDRKRVEASLRQVLSPPYQTEHEERALTPDGWRWFSWSARSIRDAEGTVASVISVGRDITEQKEAREALEESESRHRLLADNTLDVIWTMDMDLRFTYVNPAISRMFGFTADEFIGTSLRDHCTVNEFQKMGKIIEDSIAEGPDSPGTVFETRLSNRAGESVPVEIHGKVIFDENNRPVLLQGTTQDITERKHSERQLLRGKETLEEAQGVAGIGSWDYDVATDQPTWSREMFRIFGFDADQPEPCWEAHRKVIHPDDWERLDKAIQDAVTEGRHYNVKFRIVRPDGEIVWGHTLGRVTRDGDGNVIRLHGTVQDITEQVRAEAEREKLQEQLTQAQKMESIGRLAGGVAHDFNNLLTAIQGFSELVDDSLSVNDPIREDVSEIRKAADSAATLTNQLLTFSRKQIVSPSVVDLNNAVARSEKMLRRIIGEDIEFRFLPDEGVGPIFIDPGQVDQVLVNLAVNSRDAMPRGGQLIIKTAGFSAKGAPCQICNALLDGEYVQLTVSDTGHGMDAETISNIFEPFYTTKSLGKGTGLGLSTIHGIVHQNGGHIGVQSEAGQGTCFTIFFPVASEGVAESEEEPSLVDARGKETILIVEDQEMVRKLAARTLQSYGYRIIEAANGGEALLQCENPGVKIDLLLTDVVMPQMSGRDLLDRLHQVRADLKVLFMSGYTGDTIAHHGVLEDGLHFIQKPFRPQELARIVRQIIDSA